MLKELKTLLPSFRGAASQSRCFAHIVNLVVKSVMSQFDGCKKKSDIMTYPEGDDNGDVLDWVEPDQVGSHELEEQGSEGTGTGVDSSAEKEEAADWLDAGVRPVSSMLTKVSGNI